MMTRRIEYVDEIDRIITLVILYGIYVAHKGSKLLDMDCEWIYGTYSL